VRGEIVFSFYGDDFTGSTDALEALSVNGVPSVLFLRPPNASDLCKFSGCRAVGIAGESRSRPPEWMRRELPAIFECLRQIGAPLVQYKVCSTFDSSPDTGSIGCAIEIGQQVFHNRSVAVVPAAPLLGRHVVFGNLFATGADGMYRIDRHPSMRSHPITPMDESDLRIHLGRQTSRRVAGVNLLDLRDGSFQWPDADVVLFDGLEPLDLAETARLISEHREAPQTFVVGSSGFTYGLMDYWRVEGEVGASACATDRLLVLAGSCSQATEAQIRTAMRDGFHGIRLNPVDADFAVAAEDAIGQLTTGRSVILYSALGAGDCIQIIDRPSLSARMGKLLRRIIEASGVTRVVVAGGDTSTYAARELGITALTFAAPLTRGAPLCRAHGWPGELEMVLKGGQIGSERFFEEVLDYGGAP